MRRKALARSFAPGLCFVAPLKVGSDQKVSGLKDYRKSRNLVGSCEAAPPHRKATHGVSLCKVAAAMS